MTWWHPDDNLLAGNSWMHPDPNGPPYGKSLFVPYIMGTYVLWSPRHPGEHQLNMMGTLLGVHLSVPPIKLYGYGLCILWKGQHIPKIALYKVQETLHSLKVPETNISHLRKGKIIFPATFTRDMLVPWRVYHLVKWKVLEEEVARITILSILPYLGSYILVTWHGAPINE